MKQYLKDMDFEPQGLTAETVTPEDLPYLFIWVDSPQGHYFWLEQCVLHADEITPEGREALRQFFVDAEVNE